MKNNLVKKRVKKLIIEKADRGDYKGALTMLKECHTNETEVEELLEKYKDTYTALDMEWLDTDALNRNIKDIDTRTYALIDELQTF